MGCIISVANNKGGCGKTTTTCNLADALGKRNKKVLVIDMDPQCNTTNRLFPKNISIRKSVFELLDPESENNFDEDGYIANYTYVTEYKNVSIIPNIEATSNLEPDLIIEGGNSFYILKNIVRKYLVKQFDFILVDTPPNMGTFVLCSLYSSDFVIVPVKAGSMDSVIGLTKATKLIKSISKKGNPDLRFLRLLINCVDLRTSICQDVVDQIRSTFGKDKQVFKAQIPVNTCFEQSEARRETIFKVDGTSKGARAFRELAKELISLIAKKGTNL